MNTRDLQQLKMAWLVAKESGDTQTQLRLLQDHTEEQEELVTFIAAYYATGGDEPVEQDPALLPLTHHAIQSALERVFVPQVVVTTMGELRKQCHLSKVEVAKGLRLSVDVWNKFEAGAIELLSLQQRQLERLAQFFQVGIEQISQSLQHSQPAATLNWRKTSTASSQKEQGPQPQSFTEAITRSNMSKEDKQFWLES